MEPANKPSVVQRLRGKLKNVLTPPVIRDAVDFLPDADEIERRPLPRFAQLTIHLLAGGFVLFIVVASLMEVDLVVSARGKLTTPLPNIVIQAFDTALIQEINVRPGQVVKKGDTLAILDRTFTEADEQQLRNRLESLDNQRARLDQELAGKIPSKDRTLSPSDDRVIQGQIAQEKQASYLAQTQKLDENIGRLKASLETNRKDLEALNSRIIVLKELAGLQERLVAQQYAPRSRSLEAQDRLLEAERNAQATESRSYELKKELAALEADKRSFKSGWRQKITEELLSLSRERDSVYEQLQKADKRNRLVILTAPEDAVVLEIAKLSVGSIARAAEAFITLVPITEQLDVEVQIDSADIGYVKVGDFAHIKVDTFPFQLYGFLEGNLRIISQDAFKRDANGSNGGAYYQGRITLTKTQLDRHPSNGRLLPGMTAVAELAVGKRTVMSYLLWPIIKALNESVREP